MSAFSRISHWIASLKARWQARGKVGDKPKVRSRFLQDWWKECCVLLALALVLAAPWILKPKESSAPSRFDRRLVILTPNHERIRYEFGLAFARHWKKTTGEVLYVDWRVAGTSELALLIRSEYAAAFRRHWTNDLFREWNQDVASSFGNSRVSVPKAVEGVATSDASLTLPELARKTFLNSQVGMGADLFFGGGVPDFEAQAKAGILVASGPDGKHGAHEVVTKHPEWFTEAVIPATVSGEMFYDPEHRWLGTCMASLGICYNKDVLLRLGASGEPSEWEDLTEPGLVGQIALSDPNKSATVTKSLEQIIQQQMQLAITELQKNPANFKSEKDLMRTGISKGWENGLRIIQRICANARYFTDAATKIPQEVCQGDAAAGMCIDFYGKSFEEQVRGSDGRSRMGFVAPIGGTGVSVDAVAMMRGAPEPACATAFMEFVLSDEGQKLWNFKPGTPGGPETVALRRLPVRKDFYTNENRRWMADAQAQPYEDAKSFTYHPEWTSALFNVVRMLTKVMCIEVHDEQQRAWRMLQETNFPPRATQVFGDLKLINYRAAQELALELGKKDKELEMKKTREMAAKFRGQYEKAYKLAREGR